MEDKKLKVAKPSPNMEDPQSIVGFFVPNAVMDQIIGYIGQGSYLEVKDFIDHIKANVKPMFAKNQPNETENNTALNS